MTQCLDCFFKDGASGSLICRRSAPLAANSPPGTLTAKWQGVDDANWCGEYSNDDPVPWRAATSPLCSTCFFGRSDGAGGLLCQRFAPYSSSVQANRGATSWLQVSPTDWCGEWLLANPLVWSAQPPQLNIFYPAISKPSAYDNLDIDSTTDVSGIPDVTAEVQAAVDACEATVEGGVVQLPPGIVRINNLQLNGNGVEIRGYRPGFAGTSDTPSKRPKNGTYILHDTTAFSSIVVGTTANNIRISDIGFIEAQPPESPTFAPVIAPPCIQLLGPVSNGNFVLENLLFWGVYQAIMVGQTRYNGLASVYINNVSAVAFADAAHGGAIRVYGNTADRTQINNFTFDPLGMMVNNVNQQAYCRDNVYAVCVSGENTNTRVFNSHVSSAKAGVLFDGPGHAASNHQIDLCSFTLCGWGVYEGCTVDKCKVTISSGAFFNTNIAVAVTGPLPEFLIQGMSVKDTHLYALDATSGGGNVLMSPVVYVDGWNFDALGYPALHSTNAGLTVTYSLQSIFANGHGGAVTGGGGTFVAY